MNKRSAVRDALQEAAATRFRLENEALRQGDRHKVGYLKLLNSEHIALKNAERRKAFPNFIGPFKVLTLRGTNSIEVEDLSPFVRFKFVDIIKTQATTEPAKGHPIRPYKQRNGQANVSSGRGAVAALVVDLRGGTWWQVEDVVSHQPCPLTGQPKEHLVRYDLHSLLSQAHLCPLRSLPHF